jgi:hypothetical protein
LSTGEQRILLVVGVSPVCFAMAAGGMARRVEVEGAALGGRSDDPTPQPAQVENEIAIPIEMTLCDGGSHRCTGREGRGRRVSQPERESRERREGGKEGGRHGGRETDRSDNGCPLGPRAR